jgi:hypothetical protein
MELAPRPFASGAVCFPLAFAAFALAASLGGLGTKAADVCFPRAPFF